jgi:tetratricopeptide (TPR) repeat protein
MDVWGGSGIGELVLFMIRYTCNYWTPEEDQAFREMLTEASSFLPELSEEIQLLQMECYAHNVEDARALGIHPLRMMCELYEKSKSSRKASKELQAQVLMDIQLYCKCFSPLTSAKLDLDVEMRQSELSKELGGSSEREDLFSPESRIKIITELYRGLQGSFNKVKAAFVLALADEQQELHHKAERKYLEAIYILDSQPSAVKGIYGILSELATSLLQHFAASLLYQSRYKYAILVYDACAACMTLGGRTGEYFTLLRRMATISHDNDDYKRAISHYLTLLAHYVKNNKTNEVRFSFYKEIPATIYTPYPLKLIKLNFACGPFVREMRNAKWAWILRWGGIILLICDSS